MKQKFFVLLTVFGLFAICSSAAEAKLLTINASGEVIYSVLSSSDEIEPEIPKSSDIEVKQAQGMSSGGKPTIALAQKDGSVNVSVDDYGSKKEFVINNEEDVILEIEERPQISRLEIGFREGFFLLTQNKFTAYTNFAIKIDASNAKLTVSTDRGERIISVLPYGAVQYLVKAKIINKVKENKFELMEKDSELVYRVEGERLINLFDLYKLPVEVNSLVSASTGEIISVESPLWLKVINNFFS